LTAFSDSKSRRQRHQEGFVYKRVPHVTALRQAVRRQQAHPRLRAVHRGRIAVKVINHYGDEVLKIFDLET
jgi:hypothetical protein